MNVCRGRVLDPPPPVVIVEAPRPSDTTNRPELPLGARTRSSDRAICRRDSGLVSVAVVDARGS